MTVPYNREVATNNPVSLLRILYRWRGSIWKAVYIELSVWLGLYAIITMIYRLALSDIQMRTFESIAQYLSGNGSKIPIDFLLAFFAVLVITQWQQLFANLGRVDSLAMSIANHIEGKGDRVRMVKRQLIRHCVLAQVLLLRDVSMQARKRFPTLESIVAAGIMTEQERMHLTSANEATDHSGYWMPLQWTIGTLRNARLENQIHSDEAKNRISDEIQKFHNNLQNICNADWVPLPVLYPQVVFLALHLYLGICLVSRQYLVGPKNDHPTAILVFPFLTVLELIFYVGWTKVAQGLLNPLGEDDDDLEVNFIIDRNFSVGTSIVDDYCNNEVPLIRDAFFDQEIVHYYSEESADRERSLINSAVLVQSTPKTVIMVPLKDKMLKTCKIVLAKTTPSALANEKTNNGDGLLQNNDEEENCEM